MQLSADISAGLKYAGTNTITEECFSKLLDAGVDVIIDIDKIKVQSEFYNFLLASGKSLACLTTELPVVDFHHCSLKAYISMYYFAL